MRYIPQLDGLRAIAALLVTAFHCNVPFLWAGYVGVDVFFVLSGFLITRILLTEHAATGSIDLSRFYWNRFLRLFPPLALVIAAYLLLAPTLWPGYPHARDALYSGLYLADYAIPLGNDLRYLRHTWSLAVEEQFYLLWPVALIALRSRLPLRSLPYAIATLILASLMWRSYQQYLGHDAYHPLDTRLAGPLLGAWLACMDATRPGWVTRPAACAALGLFLLMAVSLSGIVLSDPWHVYVAIPAAEFATLLILSGASMLPLRAAPLVWLGKVSYGLYLWHFPIAVAIVPLDLGAATFPTVLGLSIVLAALSFYTVEAWSKSLRTSTSASKMPTVQ
ncbi:acyltransferase family protein [Pseudomonas knackmussii]|uniref:acyltransferase family protein n=1 Tax=Pseudomonas knackmussii TaxID=65741 RepID=UPI003F4A1518